MYLKVTCRNYSSTACANQAPYSSNPPPQNKYMCYGKTTGPQPHRPLSGWTLAAANAILDILKQPLQNSTLPTRRLSSHFDTTQNHSFSACPHHKKCCVCVSSCPYPRLDLLRAHRERRPSCALPCALR